MTIFSNVYDVVITSPVSGIGKRFGRGAAMGYLVLLIAIPSTFAWMILAAFG